MTPAKSLDLPQECWEYICTSLDHHRHWESLSLVSTRFFSITDQLRRTFTISSLSAPFLPRLPFRFPNLREIQVSDFHGDLNSVLSRISTSGFDLESLNLSNQKQFPSTGLRDLGSGMRNLRILNCSKMSFLQDSDLFVIGNSFPCLEDLDISFPQYNSRFSPHGSLDFQWFSGIVTDEGILDLSLKLKKLLRIDISGNHFITDKSLLSLSENCVLLREIVILDCDFITENGIGLAMRASVNLNTIALDGIGIPSIDSYFQESFACAKNLCEICLSDSFISDELLCSVAEACLPLRKLTISNCYNFSIAGIYYMLYKYQFLVYLDLEGANFITDESMIELSKLLRSLYFVNLSSCSKLTSLSFFTLLRNCPLLNDIKMERTNLGVEEITMDFVINNHVKSLNLAGNSSLSDECIKQVASCCPNLEVFEISYCPTITEEGIREVLRNCCEIRHLGMNRCMGIKNLEIGFELPKLEILKVQGPGVDNEALASIAKRCPGLLYLDLEGCLNVTAEGVNEVSKRCKFLREINLKSCDNVRADVVSCMVFSRPSLRKIIPPCGFVPTDKQMSFYLRHGCLICNS